MQSESDINQNINETGTEQMSPPHDEGKCLREEDFKRLYGLVEKVFTRMESFMNEMHQTNLSDVSRENRIMVLERDITNMFTSLREIKKEIKLLSDWRQRFEGSVKTMLAIPVLCTVITTGVALYKLLSP